MTRVLGIVDGDGTVFLERLSDEGAADPVGALDQLVEILRSSDRIRSIADDKCRRASPVGDARPPVVDAH